MGNKFTKIQIGGEAEEQKEHKLITNDWTKTNVEREKTPLDIKELLAVEELMEELRRNSHYNAEHNDIPLIPIDNSNYPYNYSRLDLPLDEEGYCQAFYYDQTEEIEKFMEKYGIVVIKEVLTEEECKLTETEIWDFIERHYKSIHRDDVTSWRNWPALKHLGILDNLLLLSPQFFRNRQNEKIYHAVKHILKSDNLRSLIMRASAMRPTYNVPWPASKLDLLPSDAVVLSNNDNDNVDGENNDNNKEENEEKSVHVEIPSWRTISEWLHWDMSPFTGATTTFASKLIDPEKNRNIYDHFRIQSILSAVDCGPNEGGFHCVPGFHHHIRGWANQNADLFDPRNRGTTINVPKDDVIRKDIQKVPIRKGSLMIWRTAIPHGTFPNHSDKMRMVQYIQFVDRNDDSMGPLLTNPNYLPPSDEFTLTPLGSLLLDFPLDK